MRRNLLIGSIIGFILIGLVFSSFGFAQQNAAKDEAFKWPRMIRIGTHGTASLGFAVTNGWGPKLAEDTGMTVRVVPEDSEVTRTVRLANRELDIISKGIGDSNQTFMGNEGFAALNPTPHSILWMFNDAPFALLVAGDSPYKSVYDLKKKGIKMGRAVQSPSLDLTVREAVPAFLGWTPEEAAENWSFVPAGGLAENARLVTDGKADVSLSVTVSGFAYELEGHPRGTRYLSMPLSDKKGWERFLNRRPAAIPMTIDFGVPSSHGVDGFAATVLYQVRADEDSELVYQLAKWIHNNMDKIKAVHALAGRMDVKHFRTFLNHSSWPVHPGTVRYLKEIGQWTEKDDEWNNAAAELLNKWSAARMAALKEAKSAGVKIQWNSQEYLDILKKHTAGLPVFAARLQ